MRKLVLTKATGVCAGEATSQMQLNWRRVKKEYFSVYLFRSAVTANAVSPVRRTTTVLKAMQMRFGRYRACRAGLTERQLAALEARLESHGYVRLRDTVYKSWKEMHDACEKDAWRYNAGVLDDPSLPEVGSGGRVRLKEALLAQHVYSMLQRAGLRLGYKPNAFGLWSLRRYSIAMVVKSFGIYLGTRQAQHNKATGSTVQSTYDADNGSLEVGAAEMDRPPEDIEPGDSLAETRVPAIFEVQRPSDVPKDSDAWRTMVLEDEEYVANAAALAAAAGRIERATATLRSRRPPAAAFKAARAELRKAAAARAIATAERRGLMNKLGHRAVVVHRQNVFDAGQAMLQDADEATLLRQTHFETYPQMSEGEAVGYLLERCNALDERDAARAECNAARKRTATTAALERAPMATESGAEREARLRARRVRRCEYLGIEPDEGARHAVTSTDPATSSAEGSGLASPDGVEAAATAMAVEADSANGLHQLAAAISEAGESPGPGPSAVEVEVEVEVEVGRRAPMATVDVGADMDTETEGVLGVASGEAESPDGEAAASATVVDADGLHQLAAAAAMGTPAVEATAEGVAAAAAAFPVQAAQLVQVAQLLPVVQAVQVAQMAHQVAQVAPVTANEALLREYEAMQADAACINAKNALVARSGIPASTLMRRLQAARRARAVEN